MKQKRILIGLFSLIIAAGLSVPGLALVNELHQPENTHLPAAHKWNASLDSVPAAAVKYEEELEPVVAHYRELGFNITPLLKDPRFNIYEGIDDRFEGSAEKTSPSLAEYKEILGFDYKTKKIDEFIAQHIKTLRKAQEQYGISKYIIAAILGVESSFGENIGSHDPFNVYVSMLVLDYRADFARAQLKHLLMFTERENIEVHSLKSSYAGAMSYAQFIPYSLNKWWVGDKLFSMKNNILSIANYLAYFKARTDDKVTMVMRYNPSSLYAHTILDLAEAARESYTAP